MRTPNIRWRTVRAGLALFVVLILGFDLLVYTTLRVQLQDNLDEVLATRAGIAADIARGESPAEAAEHLTALGVPALIRTADGELVTAEPLSPRLGGAPPAPAGVIEPTVSRTETLDDGTTVEVFASAAGVRDALNRLALVLAVGTILALAAAYLLLRRLVRDTTAPLVEVADTAERITAGDRDERLEPDQPETDLGRMASSFDAMVTSLNEAIERAEDEQERTRRFVADAAHQLRTPIAGIRSAIELLLRETDPETRDRLLAHSVRETARAGRLISALLHIARLDQGKPPRRAPTDLLDVARIEVERLRDRAPHLQVELAAPELRAGSLVAHVDREEIGEALSNLLDNALRHATGRVEVSVSAIDGEARIRVSDDGDGVEEGARELIFERFATLDGRGGSGLGLPIARGVARAHGGDLTYDDDGFLFRLPAEDEASVRVRSEVGTPGA